MNPQIQKITVAGMLVHEGKALIVRRSEKESFLPGYYELPGGKVDFGETPEDALTREFREEVNLQIKVGKPIRTFHYVTSNNTIHTVEIVFIAFPNSNISDLKLSEAHDEFKWITKTEIDSLKLSDEIRKNLKAGFEIIQNAS